MVLSFDDRHSLSVKRKVNGNLISRTCSDTDSSFLDNALVDEDFALCDVQNSLCITVALSGLCLDNGHLHISISNGSVHQRNGVIRSVRTGSLIFCGNVGDIGDKVLVERNSVLIMLHELRTQFGKDRIGLFLCKFRNEKPCKSTRECRVTHDFCAFLNCRSTDALQVSTSKSRFEHLSDFVISGRAVRE